MSKFLRTKEAAEYLGVSERTLEAWRTNGGGCVYRKIGGCVRYAPEDLDAFVDAGRRTSTSQVVEAGRSCSGRPGGTP